MKPFEPDDASLKERGNVWVRELLPSTPLILQAPGCGACEVLVAEATLPTAFDTVGIVVHIDCLGPWNAGASLVMLVQQTLAADLNSTPALTASRAAAVSATSVKTESVIELINDCAIPPRLIHARLHAAFAPSLRFMLRLAGADPTSPHACTMSAKLYARCAFDS